jgi:cell division protein FtsL
VGVTTGADDWFGRISRLAVDGVEIRRSAPYLAVVISVAVIIVGLFYVWTRMQVVQIGYETSSLEEKNKELQNRKRELLLEIASLQSPAELQQKAVKQGLRFPDMGKVLHVP